MSFFGCGVLGSSKQQLDCRFLQQTTHRGPWTRRSAEETRRRTASYNKLRTEVRGHAGRQKKRGDAPLLTTNYAQRSVDTQVGRRNEETHRFLQQTTHRGRQKKRGDAPLLTTNYAQRSVDTQVGRRNEETHRFLQQTTHRGPWTRRSAEETRRRTASYNKLRTEVRGHAGRQKKRGDAPLLTTNYAQRSVDTQVGRRNEEPHRFLQQTTHRGPWTRRSAEETRSRTGPERCRSIDAHWTLLRRVTQTYFSDWPRHVNEWSILIG